MDILRDFVMPAIIIILVLVMIALWVMNCIQINKKKPSPLYTIIVIASGVLIIVAILFLRLGMINRVGSDVDRNTIHPVESVNPSLDPSGNPVDGMTSPALGEDGGFVLESTPVPNPDGGSDDDQKNVDERSQELEGGQSGNEGQPQSSYRSQAASNE